MTSRSRNRRFKAISFACIVYGDSTVDVQDGRRERILAEALDHKEKLPAFPNLSADVLSHSLGEGGPHALISDELPLKVRVKVDVERE